MAMKGFCNTQTLGCQPRANRLWQSCGRNHSYQRSHTTTAPNLLACAFLRGWQKPWRISASLESLGEEPREETVTAAAPRPWWSSPHDGRILRFAIPALLANLVIPISSAIDIGVVSPKCQLRGIVLAVVGRIGPAELSSVGVGTISVAILTSCLSFLAVLTTRFVAQRHAEQKTDEVHTLSRNKFLLIVILQISVYLAKNLWFCFLFGAVLTIIVGTQADSLINRDNPNHFLYGNVCSSLASSSRDSATGFKVHEDLVVVSPRLSHVSLHFGRPERTQELCLSSNIHWHPCHRQCSS